MEFITKWLVPTFLVVVFFSVGESYAQEISGKVTGSTGEVLVGVSVVVKGTQIGTSTDAAGLYSVQANASEPVLVFSYIGYASKEVQAGNQTRLDVVLEIDNKSLEEVVVVGYGTKKKSDLTGAISQVKPAELKAVAAPNVTQALQGRAAGVSVSTDNQPGAQPVIRIRGVGSINASNNPLIVLDGFPLVNGNMNDINSNDIESVEILKDASSAAIYGSRGANGVIMVTTKKGAVGKKNFSFSSYYGIQSPARLVKMINRDEFVNFINAAYLNQTGKPVYSEAKPAPAHDTDWQKAIIKGRAPIQDYTLTFDGGNADTRYLLSAGLFSQDGLLHDAGFKRYSIRTNLDHKFTKWLSVGTHLQLNRSVQDINPGAPTNIFRFGWPTMPVRNADGSFYFAADDPQHAAFVEGRWNPVADANEKTDQTTTNRILGDIYAEFKITPHLSFRTNAGADVSGSRNFYYATSKHSAGRNSGGIGSQLHTQAQTLINENVLTYQNTWNQHNLSVNGVYSYQEYQYTDLSVSGSGFPTDLTGIDNISIAKNLDLPKSNKYSSKLISWTGRASYAFKDRYLLTATGRYDGSSRFGTNNKWGFFPSIGLGWKVIEEGFLKNVKSISNLKLRASYGQTGNQEIGNYMSLPSLNAINYIYNNELMLGFLEGLGNPNLKWEKTTQYDAGIDIGLWNDRLDISVDYYKRNTTNLLYNVPIPTTSGFTSMLQNIGEVENRGLEITMNARILEGPVKWSLGGNVTKNKNEVVALYGDVNRIRLADNQGVAQFLIVGQPVNGVWARESAGIIKTQGEVEAVKAYQPFAEIGAEMYVNKNGDKSINEDDYKMIGTQQPNFYYGITTNVEWKSFRLDILGQGATNIASTSTDYLLYGENQIQNRNYIPSKYAYDRMWSPENPGGTFPKAGAKEVYLSDRTNGGRNYFMVKNIRLNYALNPSLFKTKWFSGINVYANAQNYISFTNFRGYNPENGNYDFPLAKALIFGLNANF
ncbi:SusC/RagA family TonB-linked outer membrane protein [Dyadobacter aurulentus]|uniref:SusC/RagA family TonB-linked outer membrane protein n=1 Tax=Dyadobacter sp. UC 10 TaxID=2605428 RepID=UPI0011F361DC|nr:TonB-dependent receptor [Dyadobacter sp. UC 10]KAA0989142.1 TonB-dependent receptor [Dyadobacter sp. UC 10]